MLSDVAHYLSVPRFVEKRKKIAGWFKIGLDFIEHHDQAGCFFDAIDIAVSRYQITG
jgi:hypothetical protein